jgi:hypothetical protein
MPLLNEDNQHWNFLSMSGVFISVTRWGQKGEASGEKWWKSEPA